MTKHNIQYAVFLLIQFLVWIGETEAQQTPWTYVGGLTSLDKVTDITIGEPFSTRRFACIQGGEGASPVFKIVCLDENGKLLWTTEINKNAFPEVPASMTLDKEGSVLGVTGYANDLENLWFVKLNPITGDTISTSGLWSDLTNIYSGRTAKIGQGDTTGFHLYYFQNDSLVSLIPWNPFAFPPYSVHLFPVSESDETHVLSDCESFVNGNLLTGSYGPNYQPYVWLLNGIDSIFFDALPDDSILLNAISPNDTVFSVIGNLLDSSAIYVAFYEAAGAGYNLDLDTIYPSPGYKIVGKDMVQNTDGTYEILSVHYDPSGTRSVIMHISETGDILSETTLFPEESAVELSHLKTPFEINAPYVFGGFINTETLEKQTEFLIASSNTNQIFPGCIYDCVWPGDANNDGTVDMTDLFPIGAFCFYHGPVRDSVSIYWIGDVADEWIYNYGDLNAKYGNCDGDTMIYFQDTTAIVANYSDTHAVFTLKNNGGDIPIWLNTTGIILTEGYNEIPIMLGTEEIPVDSIYGLEFSISYEGLPVIDSASMRVKFHDSWLGNASEMIQLDTLFFGIHAIDAGVVNTLHANHSGYGEIGKLSFVVEDNIAGIMIASGDSTIIFNITGPTAVLNDLSEVSISGSAWEVLVSTEVNNEIPENNLMIFPNPWHGEALHIYPENIIKNNFRFELNAIDGSRIETGELHSDLIELNNKISAGEYILKIIGDDHVYQFKLIHL